MELKKTAVLAGALLLLCGCMRVGNPELSAQEAPATEPEDTAVKVLSCTKDKSSMTYNAKGDEITTITQVVRVDITDMNLDQDVDSPQVEKAVNKSVSNLYSGIKGLKTQTEIKDKEAVITVSINLMAADLNQLIEKGILDKGEMQNKYVSLNKTSQALKEMGCQCTLKETE